MKYNDVHAIINNSKFSSFQKRLLVICFVIAVFEGYDLYMYGTVVPFIIKEWSLSTVQTGMIGSYGLFGMMIGSFVFGALADKIGRRNLILICIVLFSLFTALCGFANGPTTFSWFRFIAGLGIGGFLPNITALMTDYTPKHIRNSVVAIMLSGMQLGGLLGPVVSLTTLKTFQWHGVLWFAALPILFLPIIYRSIPESPVFLLVNKRMDELYSILSKITPDITKEQVQQLKINTSNEKSAPLVRVFQNGRALSSIMFGVAYFMSLLMVYGLSTWLPNIMINAGYGISSGLTFALILNFGCVLGTLVFARIADKWINARKLMIILYLVGTVSITLMGFKFNTAILYGLVFMIGAAIFATQNIANAFVSQYYPSEIRSSGLGLINTIGRWGGIFGPTLGGVLLTINVPVFFNFLTFAVAALIAAVAYAIVRERTAKRVLTQKDRMDQSV